MPKRFAIVLLLWFIAVSCSDGASDQETTRSSSATQDATNDQRSPDEIVDTVSACPPELLQGDRAIPSAIFGWVEEWWQIDSANVTALLERDSPPSLGRTPETFEFVGRVVSGARTGQEAEGGEITSDVYVAAALAEATTPGTEVFAAVDRNERIVFVLLRLADGSSVFGGGCAQQMLMPPIEAQSNSAEILAKLTTVVGEDLANLATPETAPVADSKIQILNPNDAPEGLLESLNSVILFYRLDEPIFEQQGAICTRSSAGWNDCFFSDAKVANDGIFIEAFFGDDALLEVYLFEDLVDLGNPGSPIGSLRVEGAAARSQGEYGFDVDISAESAREGALDAARFTERPEKLSELE